MNDSLLSGVEIFFEKSKYAALFINENGFIEKSNYISKTYKLEVGVNIFEKLLNQDVELIKNFIKNSSDTENKTQVLLTGFPELIMRTYWTILKINFEKKYLLICDQVYHYSPADFLIHNGLMKAVLDNDPNLVYVTNRLGEILFANRSFFLFFGLDFIQDSLEDVNEIILRTPTKVPGYQGADVPNQNQFRPKLDCITNAIGEEFWFENMKIPFSTEYGEKIFLHISKDMSRWKESERKFLEQQRTLFEKSKVGFLQDMAAGVSHEINNPLSIMLGKIQLLRNQINDEETEIDRNFLKSQMSKIEEAGERISNIVHIMKTFSPNKKTRSFHTLGEIVNSALLLFKEKNNILKIKFEFDKTNWNTEIPCISAEISLILVNLFTNALEALQHNIDNNETAVIKLKSEIDEQNIEIYVSNNGVPIFPDLKNRIFDPFFTTKLKTKNIGLGLSISLKIANEHGGNLFLDPNSKETTFVLKLPIVYNNKKE